jgi:hypothetical protein
MLMGKRKAIEARDDNLSGFIFIDEDFFIHGKRTKEFLEDILKEFGFFTLNNRLECWVTVPPPLGTWTKENLGSFQQPSFLCREYRL